MNYSAATDLPKDQGSSIQSNEIKPRTEVLSPKEIQCRMLEMVKASFPNGIPPIIDVGSTPRITVTPKPVSKYDKAVQHPSSTTVHATNGSNSD
jgi:hypothetical protein